MSVGMDMREMMARQAKLQARYAGWWEAVDPAHGTNKLLWMLAELGEAIQIVKREGADGIMQQQNTRRDFIEEMADVLMYFNDVLLCYGVKPEEFENVYREKNERNMTRWKKPDESLTLFSAANSLEGNRE